MFGPFVFNWNGGGSDGVGTRDVGKDRGISEWIQEHVEVEKNVPGWEWPSSC